jgi:hypothetical protein
MLDSDPAPEVHRYRHQTLKISDFMHEWSKGLPLVITDVLIQGRWDPQYFIDNYGSKGVTLVNCETGETRPSKVRKFFNLFLRPEERTGIWAGIWKLKVMSSASFLFLEFSQPT